MRPLRVAVLFSLVAALNACSRGDADDGIAPSMAAVRLPAKFGRRPNQGAEVYQAVDGEIVAINIEPGDIRRNMLAHRAALRVLLSKTMHAEIADSDMVTMPLATMPARERSTLLRVNIPGKPDPGYVGTIYCPKISQSLVSMNWAPEGTDEQAVERLSEVGCPGEPTNKYPSFWNILDAACAARDAMACETKRIEGR